MNNETQFLVQGSAPEPYTVTLYLLGSNLSASCTCPAGQYGTYCKHRIAVLSGDTSSIVSDNVAEVAVVTRWLIGTPLADALADFLEAERLVAHAKTRMANAKKRVAEFMVETP